MMTKRLTKLTAILALTAAVAGCESHAGNGALIGGAAGAGIGAIVGHNSHGRTGEGALIGGAVGALAGGVIGNEQDKAERRDEDRYARRSRYDRDRYQDDRYDRDDRYQSESGRYYEEER